ncbi:type II secretion system F family protein [Sediminivirga luteola]|uniref:type II secretion system F family protein n=1 Tax=Sediminivirga luteola TaxID=1774748 RepID=UPI001F5632FD|nr:type II secretion system F family protein [Sediminivirga luteola]MCI2266467.1 type II secretion system F family protein [Sediminivirga luteola]
MNPEPLALILGAVLGLALWGTLLATPPLRRRTLADRIGPYVTPATPPSGLLGAPAGRGGLNGLLGRHWQRSAEWLAGRLGSSPALARRIERLGPGHSVEQYRAGQLVLTVAGLGVGTVLAVAIGAHRGFLPGLYALLLAAGGGAGYLLADWRLSSRVRKREARILAEFPTIAELLALSVSAGESTTAALERVASTSSGELAAELRSALGRARTGSSLPDALDALARRLDMDVITQFVDGIAVALSRGSPLAEVLRAQAADVREASRRELMEQGGRKEVGMLVPVVLFVLPVTVLFAIFPSFTLLRL